MLTDRIVEEEFDMKEEEPWYDKRDLEHDLHLAAELGKTLLERNKELEQGLQHMYSTNQEQLQEIEYLAKQVDVLRQVNDQHAKVYEQLDASSRELEQTNHRLGVDNRSSQQKNQSLTETAEGLQSQVDELQRELEALKPVTRPSRRTPPPGDTRSTHSVSCLTELQSTLRYHDDHYHDDASDELLAASSELEWRAEEQASLRRSLRTLQTQLATERAGREEAEREADVLANENAALERQLDVMEGCRARLAEVESEATELRQLWRTECSARSPGHAHRGHAAPPTPLFLNRHDDDDDDEEEEAGNHHDEDEDSLLSCAVSRSVGTRRSEAVKYRGISLLNEVDAQYSALQVKYDELLRRCGGGGSPSLTTTSSSSSSSSSSSPPGPDTTTTTTPSTTTSSSCSSSPPGPDTTTTTTPSTTAAAEGQNNKAIQSHRHSVAVCTDLMDDFQQPEYKELFREIFKCIQRTKGDLSEARGTPPACC